MGKEDGKRQLKSRRRWEHKRILEIFGCGVSAGLICLRIGISGGFL